MTVTPESVVAQTGTWAAISLFYMLLVPAVVLWYAYWRMSRRHMYELAAKIGGPSGLPILGNALEFTGGSHGTYKYPMRRIWIAKFIVSVPEVLIQPTFGRGTKLYLSLQIVSKLFLYSSCQNLLVNII